MHLSQLKENDNKSKPRILVAIPAYNEETTIQHVVNTVRRHLPGLDLLVVNDGSSDATAKVLCQLKVTTAAHLCNLGYGRAIQTAIKYAQINEYDMLVTLDADGQHHPEQVRGMLEEFMLCEVDVMIGSRYIKAKNYSDSPLGRRIGMRLFSALTGTITQQRVYDTTSGLKIIRRRAFEPLTKWQFVDFHAEAIIYLLRLGYRIGEYPITVSQRVHGQSMYSALSHIDYPLKTCMMVFLGVIQAGLNQRRNSYDRSGNNRT